MPLFQSTKINAVVWSPVFLNKKIHSNLGEINFPETGLLDKMGQYLNEENKKKTFQILKNLSEISKSLNCTITQLAYSWSLLNKNISCYLISGNKENQLEEYLQIRIINEKITPIIQKKIERILNE